MSARSAYLLGTMTSVLRQQGFTFESAHPEAGWLRFTAPDGVTFRMYLTEDDEPPPGAAESTPDH